MKTLQQMLTEWENATATEDQKTFQEIISLRAALISEEYIEVINEMFLSRCELLVSSDLTRELSKKQKAALLKELCDLVYVAVETAVKLGLPFDEGFARVHENNMTKLIDGKVIRAENGKILKPEGYIPCDLMEIVE